jgi:hypothetical protein
MFSILKTSFSYSINFSKLNSVSILKDFAHVFMYVEYSHYMMTFSLYLYVVWERSCNVFISVAYRSNHPTPNTEKDENPKRGQYVANT